LAYALGINGVAGIIAVTITGHWPSPHDAMQPSSPHRKFAPEISALLTE
jgi:hypothetical protein